MNGILNDPVLRSLLCALVSLEITKPRIPGAAFFTFRHQSDEIVLTEVMQRRMEGDLSAASVNRWR